MVQMITLVVGFMGDIEWDITKSIGTPRKVMNVDRIKALVWEPKISLRESIEKTYEWYKKNENTSL